MTENAATLIRVSSDGQDEHNQSKDIGGHVKTHDYNVVKTFELHDVSASKGEQESTLKQIMADMQAGLYHVLVIAHSSRIDRRDPRIQRLYTDSVSLAGGRIESAREAEFGKNTMGGDIMTVVSQWANFNYTKDLGEHIKASKDTKRNKGLWGGGPIKFGYRVVCKCHGLPIERPTEKFPDKAIECPAKIAGSRDVEPTYAIDDEAAKIVIEIANRLLGIDPAHPTTPNGESSAAIARDLNRRGLMTSTGSKWAGNALTVAMRSPTYKGFRVWYPTHDDGKRDSTPLEMQDFDTPVSERHYPQILSDELWDKVQAKLDDNGANCWPSTATVHDKSMLSGIVTCPCKIKFYQHAGREYTKVDTQVNHDVAEKCPHGVVPISEVDDKVNEWIMTHSYRIIEMVQVGGNALVEERKRILAEIQKTAKLAGRIPDFMEVMAKLNTRLSEIDNAKPEPVRFEPRATGKTLASEWATWDAPQRRQFLKDNDFKIVAWRQSHEAGGIVTDARGSVNGLVMCPGCGKPAQTTYGTCSTHRNVKKGTSEYECQRIYYQRKYQNSLAKKAGQIEPFRFDNPIIVAVTPSWLYEADYFGLPIEDRATYNARTQAQQDEYARLRNSTDPKERVKAVEILQDRYGNNENAHSGREGAV